MQALGLLLFLDTLSPFRDNVVGSFANILIGMTSELSNNKAGLGSLCESVVSGQEVQGRDP
jgi:hypothetical protein